MIVSFYDKNFKGLKNNASLVVDNASYSLVKRGVDFDSLSCKCEPFDEDIQPTFVVVKNDRGNYIYAALAGIPQLNKDNQTEIVGSDLKTMLKNDIFMRFADSYASVNELFKDVFSVWQDQINKQQGDNKGIFSVELRFKENVGTIDFDYMKPSVTEWAVYDAWEDIFAPYLKYYGLFMTSDLDLINKKIIFTIGRAMYRDKNIKLWEHGIRSYGKWVASVNETQCVVYNKTVKSVSFGFSWILTSENAITVDDTLRDIYPIKRKVIWKEMESAVTGSETAANRDALLAEGNQEALEELTKSMFNENIEISGVDADFETRFNIYVRKGQGKYKSLPCGELHYNAGGLAKVQIGYRFTGLQFLL